MFADIYLPHAVFGGRDLIEVNLLASLGPS